MLSYIYKSNEIHCTYLKMSLQKFNDSSLDIYFFLFLTINCLYKGRDVSEKACMFQNINLG